MTEETIYTFTKPVELFYLKNDKIHLYSILALLSIHIHSPKLPRKFTNMHSIDIIPRKQLQKDRHLQILVKAEIYEVYRLIEITCVRTYYQMSRKRDVFYKIAEMKVNFNVE